MPDKEAGLYKGFTVSIALIAAFFSVGMLIGATLINTMLLPREMVIWTRSLYGIIVICILSVAAAAALLGFIYFFVSGLKKRLNEALSRLELLALSDELTGLYNRRYIIQRFGEEFARSKRAENDLGCILIDLDRFRSVNDDCGHVCGDEVLKKFSNLARTCLRVYDIVGRIGGEEFIVLLPRADREHVKAIAERIRECMEKHLVLDCGSRSVGVTISLGCTNRGDEDDSMDSMYRRADEALCMAKENGRNRVEAP